VRTVTYSAACSLDGFIAARDGGIDWLHFSPDVQEVMRASWATIDTILMGRKTWDFAAAQGGGGGGGGQSGIETYGGDLARTLFQADVIDEVRLNIHPVLLGSGVPLFRDAGRRVPLSLVEALPIDGGCVVATYRVRR
jgi:dihydrofolate reductase